MGATKSQVTKQMFREKKIYTEPMAILGIS